MTRQGVPLVRRARVRRRAAAVVAALCLAPVLLPLVVTTPATAGGTVAVPDAARGRWSVVATPSGPEAVWRAPGRLPTTDARPELRVDGTVVAVPDVDPDGHSVSVPLAALGGADAGDLEVWLGARRLDVTSQPTPPAPGQATSGAALARQAVTPGTDPGLPGPRTWTAFDYTAPDLPWPTFDAPMEVLGHAVLPDEVDHAPLVVFLHGRHIACYGPHDHGFWPCAPTSQPVPSYLGYTYLQELLASQGYASVSISANAVNAQDGMTNDGGARARGTLVRHHLELLAGWSADPADAQWGGRLDLDRVVLVGHSRGGEGVDQAAIDTPADAPYRLLGQVLLAPTDFGWQTASYLPTEVLLGYCDGDVSDLQGQRYVDAAPLLAPDDPSLRSSVLLMGANHNFFNTEWTPRISQAPSTDDWWNRTDPVCGSRTSPTRLTAAEQRRAAQTWVAAGVHAFLAGDPAQADDSLAWIDAGEPVALPAAGPAVALTAALGGHRSTVGLDGGATAAGAAAPCLAGEPYGDLGGLARTVPGDDELCGIHGFDREPHWTPTYPSPASVHAADAASGLAQQERLAWTTTGAEGGWHLAQPLDLGGEGTSLDLRVVVDPDSPPVDLEVVLGAGGETFAAPARTLQPLPGFSDLAALWAQTLRVDPDDYRGHLDLAQVDSVQVRTVSDLGRLWLLDASRREPGLAPVPDTSLPVVHLGRVVQPEGSATTGGTALLPFRVTGEVTAPARFAVAAEQWTWGWRRRPQFVTVDLELGQTAGTIAVRYQADDVDDLGRVTQRVHAVAKRGVALSRFVGDVVVRDDDPSPAVTFEPAPAHVAYGDEVVFRVHLSAPVDYWVDNQARAVRRPGVRPLRTSDVSRAWLRAQLGQVPDDVPLWRVWRWGFVDLPPGATTARLVIPTRAHPRHPGAKVLTVRFTARPLDAPLVASARVGS
ncbi:hypothetical protein [Nocardioides taihuensis]|uniref:Alpha/beta hydrolase n=1 Tax=Nocardioides taihuensis TaxID=1835606 RepID=A0ABW0BPZ6_9ACTN